MSWLLRFIPKRPWIYSSTGKKKIEHIFQIALWAKIKNKKIESIFLYCLPDSRGSGNPYSLSYFELHTGSSKLHSLLMFWGFNYNWWTRRAETYVWECTENLSLSLPLVLRPHLGDVTSAWLGSNPGEVFLLLPRLSLISKTVRTCLKCWVQPDCFPIRKFTWWTLSTMFIKTGDSL